jgi:hypothetical protein
MLRAAICVACLLISSTALAQQPPKLEPIPEPPPVPADGALEPQVTIVKRGQDNVEEYRLRGRLYMIKVTPPHGRPYYLVDNRGDGHFAREEPLDSGLRVPMWVIKKF